METKQNKVILTGIKPTGDPHLGNYCGAIKPMVEFINAKKEDETIYMFIADIHALNGGLAAAEIRNFTYALMATYLACGMDPEKVIIFRQSAVRQHAELGTLLNNVTSKGLMNRAHSYKAAVDKNVKELHRLNDLEKNIGNTLKSLCIPSNSDEETRSHSKKAHDLFGELVQFTNDNIIKNININEYNLKIINHYKDKISSFIGILNSDLNLPICKTENENIVAIEQYVKFIKNYLDSYLGKINDLLPKRDSDINMGLYSYPILMAADILLYQTNTVPVGKDQIQHIEMTRDIAGTFNSRYSDTFTLPDYESKEDAPEIKGLDGRKMSKSYGNNIPIFCEENELKSLIKKIITDSALPEEPKENVEDSTLVQLYALFADENELQSYKDRLAKGGFSYGDAKQELFELINADLAMKRTKYKHYMENRKELDVILERNEELARRVAEKTIRKVKKKMGLVAG